MITIENNGSFLSMITDGACTNIVCPVVPAVCKVDGEIASVSLTGAAGEGRKVLLHSFQEVSVDGTVFEGNMGELYDTILALIAEMDCSGDGGTGDEVLVELGAICDKLVTINDTLSDQTEIATLPYKFCDEDGNVGFVEIIRNENGDLIEYVFHLLDGSTQVLTDISTLTKCASKLCQGLSYDICAEDGKVLKTKADLIADAVAAGVTLPNGDPVTDIHFTQVSLKPLHGECKRSDGTVFVSRTSNAQVTTYTGYCRDLDPGGSTKVGGGKDGDDMFLPITDSFEFCITEGSSAAIDIVFI